MERVGVSSSLPGDKVGTFDSTSRQKSRANKSAASRPNGIAKHSARHFSSDKPDDSRDRMGSMMWTILLLGLLFSLVDVFYMILLVDQQGATHQAPNSSSKIKENASSWLAEIPAVDKKERLNQTDSRIFEILRRAGVSPSKLNQETIDDLPSWSEVVRLYGDKPVILGLERCALFQARTQGMGFVSTAGTFNSGTNLMAELLIANCHMQERMNRLGAQNRGVRWQVPWGKHTPPGDEAFRQSHKTSHDVNVDANSILPAVTIRDPLTWLVSMCHHNYGAHWEIGDDNRCPDFSLPNLETTVQYSDFKSQHESILHLWNDYYKEYINASFDRLIVRLEDLVFHPEEVTTKVCECAGGSMRLDGKFKYIVDSAKKGDHAHGSTRTGFVDAIIKYGSEKRRYESYKRKSDLEYAAHHLDETVTQLMRYSLPEPELANSNMPG